MKIANVSIKTFIAFLCGLILSNQLIGQQNNASTVRQSGTSNAISSTTQIKHQAKKVGFRLTDWKTMHTQPGEAESTIKTLEEIGCEVVSKQHGNHTDVSFRCPNWKSMEVPTTPLTQQWSSWLADKGMETVVMDPPADTQNPTVQFRLTSPKKIHMHDAVKSQKIVVTMKLIGVQVTETIHGNHLDATLECPQWKTIELQTEDSAHSWQHWLNDAGFETRHTHQHAKAKR